MSRVGAAAIGIVAVLLAAGAVTAALLGAPGARTPQPTAYDEGPGQFGAARDLVARSGFRLQAVVSDLRLLTGQGLLVIPEAARSLPAGEVQALEAHLARGGSVWVAGGTGLSRWLADKGAAIGTQPLLESQAGTNGTSEVRLTADLGGQRLDQVASRLPGTLLLDETSTWEPWLTAPATAHLDLDGDGAIGQADPPGPFLVGAWLRMPAGGRLIATADASLLADDQMTAAGRDNGALMRALLGELRPGVVLIDETQHGWTAAEAPLVAGVRAVAAFVAAPLWTAAAVAAGVGLLAIALALTAAPLRPYGNHRPSDGHHPPATIHATDPVDVAWDLLSERTGRPLPELKQAGSNAAQGLADDPVLRRVLLGRGSADDRHRILLQYLEDRRKDPT